jgi:hypothetical protein
MVGTSAEGSPKAELLAAASDFAHHLEIRLPLSQWDRRHNRPTIRPGLALVQLEMHGAPFDPDHAPHHSTASDQRPDGDPARRGAVLDVAIRKPKGEDRRRDSASLHPPRWRQVLRSFCALHVGGRHAVSTDARHTPALALASHRVSNRGECPAGEVVLEVTVRVPDQQRLCGHVQGMSAFAIAKLVSPCRLHGAIAHAPLVLGQEHAAELGEADGRILEHSHDRLAIGNREGDEILLGVQGSEKRDARVLEVGSKQEPSQFGNALLANGNTGEPHASDATRHSGATNRARFTRISPVFKFTTGREGGFSRGETRAAQISFPCRRRTERSRVGRRCEMTTRTSPRSRATAL